MKNKVALLACLIFSSVLYAQQQAGKAKNDCGCSFSSVNNAGLLEGSGGSALQLQTINGMRYGKWFAGIGIGLDRYKFRTVPLFVDVRRDLLDRINTPFLYGDIGYNFPWVEKKNQNAWETYDYKGGLYYDAGVGYKLMLGKQRALLFSGGFSLKRLHETRYQNINCIFPPCGELEGDRYEFTLKRFSLKAGLQL
ncbi:MAG TPA: hypothetical protein VD996_15005 [Chitinophagaceae bacterium]|nr:hypothetical protein [Chitinophagaceae bacterium]